MSLFDVLLVVLYGGFGFVVLIIVLLCFLVSIYVSIDLNLIVGLIGSGVVYVGVCSDVMWFFVSFVGWLFVEICDCVV